MKDLTFIAEGNPDFFKGGLINLTKRRQVNDLHRYHFLFRNWEIGPSQINIFFIIILLQFIVNPVCSKHQFSLLTSVRFADSEF